MIYQIMQNYHTWDKEKENIMYLKDIITHDFFYDVNHHILLYKKNG